MADGLAEDGILLVNTAKGPEDLRYELRLKPTQTVAGRARHRDRRTGGRDYEAEHGRRRLNFKPRAKKPVLEWLKRQGRFRHLFQSEHEALIGDLQREVDRRWAQLLELCGEKP